ncbi:MAG: 2,3,4,5-tetrahydropyridine-2,6-carboxylate N-succinyltransferase [Rhodobacterales bacterium CG2_30_65_12]|nr:MAG: 2,3,4,5-tetrahydropyridine-2,6-carboxylate N-succinyltransferase [Rhodobacterales bacterium CG2_30_65_12]
MATASELPIQTNASATQMAQEIFGDGVTVVSASYSGDNRSSGIYTNGDAVAPGVTPADTGVMLSTGRLSSFTNSSGDPNVSSSTTTNTSGVDNNADFNALAGARTYDASILDADFIPDGDMMSLQFVFSSDEYPEYAGTIYNDVVGVWVNGQPVQLSIGTGETSVGAVNQTSNENLYVDNTTDAYNTEMDGFTVTMTLKFPVIAGAVNSIRIGIADVVDSSYDSTLLIAGNSAQTALIANDDSVTIGLGGNQTIDVTANDSGPGTATLYITHINGIPVVAGDSVTLTTGQVVTLNGDGTLSVQADLDQENVNFSYTIAAGSGASAVTDSAFVTINQVPCFVAGTRIATADGEVAVERLATGDLVLTKDNGPQPVRWVGRRRVAAVGALAPIRIAANTFGAHGELFVSPQHRVLIHDAIAELLFGEPEVLVAAKDLVNDSTVRPVEGGEVEYVHILFDAHQVVFSEGLATESFLPGPQIAKGFERAAVDEIRAIFPELDPETGRGFPPAARRTLRRFEAALLTGQGQGRAA